MEKQPQPQQNNIKPEEFLNPSTLSRAEGENMSPAPASNKERATQQTEERFGLRSGQVRFENKLTHDSGWYDRSGKKLGWGDLDASDFQKISKELEPDEMFIILSQHDSFFNFVDKPDKNKSKWWSTVDPKEKSPGTEYVAENAMCVISQEKFYMVSAGREKDKNSIQKGGLSFEVLTPDEMKALVLNSKNIPATTPASNPEKPPQSQNDINPEAFLNPENMPPFIDLEYREMLGKMAIDVLRRWGMTTEELVLLGRKIEEKNDEYYATATEKYDEPEGFFAKLIMWDRPPHKEEKITEEMKEAQAREARAYLSLDKDNKTGGNGEAKEKKTEEESEETKLHVRAVGMMCESLKNNKHLKQLVEILSVSSALAGCASMPGMVQTGIYGVQQVAQAGLYTGYQYHQADAYGKYRTDSDFNYGRHQAKSSYDDAMYRAGQNRINALNRIRYEKHREPTQEEAAPIEAQYASDVENARQQARNDTENVQTQAKQNIRDTNYQKQQIVEQGVYQATSSIAQTGFQILNQAIQGIQYGGHGYHSMGYSSWHHPGGWR